MTRRPRVLVLSTTFPARPDDATPRFVLELAEAMSDEYEFTVLAPRVAGSTPRARIGRVDVVRFPYFPRRWEGVADGATLPNVQAQPWRALELPSLMSLFMTHAWRLARRLQPDLVHAHWLLPCGVFGAVLRERFGTPLVVTAHGVDMHALRRQPFEALRRWTLARADAVGTDSAEIAAIVDELGARTPARPIPMGVNASAMRDAIGQRNPVPGRFLFVGRLAPKKGVSVLLRALARVPDATLAIAGDGPERVDLESEATRLDLGGRVRFLGALGRHDVVAQLRDAYALVIPSLVAADGDREGTPVVLSEGIAAGVPVIASDLAGAGERISSGVNGQLVEPGSVDALRDALEWSLDHPELLDKMATEAGITALRGITLADTADGYTDLYRAALGTGARA
ncbi:MAG TPA: glycosyltransferase [Acidimicrobiia bacterium]|nr:glycosyltransferase [Acidimicrobiia bacterium]